MAGGQREAARVRRPVPGGRELADEALALIPAATWVALLAEMLVAKAEVMRLAGERDEARDCLRQALDIYTERHAVPLAERTRSRWPASAPSLG